MNRLLAALSAAAICASAAAYTPKLNDNAPMPGFAHPGLLHTQQDFDRVKRQIEDGNPRVMAALKVLLEAEYSQAECNAPGVCDTVRRGGNKGENYISACRAASIAYQNALRWKLQGTEANARKAVEVLNAWAKGCKAVTGDTNQSLAFGLNGYAFAQAAELMRDYQGWSRADFDAFRQWMLDVWYPGSLDFLVRRHDTWLNASRPKIGQRPGHYWSNWGLCNVLNLMSIGVLCDDATIYNQGVSFFKYNHTGTSDPEGSDHLSNHGLNEYIGNLVPRLTPDSRSSLGEWGQMQESGRDQGHTLLSIGLAADVCQVAWNQGDDLFGLMDCRLAKGIEYAAAYNYSEVDDLPFYPYHYATCTTAWDKVTPQDCVSATGRGGLRPIWGRVVAHYQGVKGISMPYSVKAMETVGTDWGGKGAVSGGYDHMGYNMLMCLPEDFDIAETAPLAQVPTPLKGSIITPEGVHAGTEYGAIAHKPAKAAEPAKAALTFTLCPEIADGSADSGSWLWSTGETSRQITVTPHRSGVWKVCYTNPRGVKSYQMFTIAVENDGTTIPDGNPHVSNSRSGKRYSTFDAALAEAQAADTLLVSGTAMVTDRVAISKDLVIEGATPDAALCRDFNNKICILVNGGASATFSGITLTSNGNACSTAYLEASAKSTATLRGVTLSGIHSSHPQGIVAAKSGAALVFDGVDFADASAEGGSHVFVGTTSGLSLDGACSVPTVLIEKPTTVIAVGNDYAADEPIAITLATPADWQTGAPIATGTRDASLFTLANDARGLYPHPDGIDVITVGQATSGLTSAEADSGEPVYYNLQGIRISAPRPGQPCIVTRPNSVSITTI